MLQVDVAKQIIFMNNTVEEFEQKGLQGINCKGGKNFIYNIFYVPLYYLGNTENSSLFHESCGSFDEVRA